MLNLMHVAVHAGINRNAGDIVLVDATRRCFEYFLGPIAWTLHQAWEPFDVAFANQHDGVVVGGGGMLLLDQEGAHYEASGWQWNSTIEDVKALKVPLIVFAIGNNRFRGHDYSPSALPHFQAVLSKCLTAGFIGLRERDTGWVHYQPCPTTCLWQLYPSYRTVHIDGLPQRIGINVAFDREALRFPGDTGRCLYDLAVFCNLLKHDGYDIALINHKPDDEMFASYFTPQDISMYQLSSASTDQILTLYSGFDLIIGMRSHSQLIPFGLRKRIVSVISHDKLARFLDDIGHPEWGVDVLAPMFDVGLREAYREASCQRQSIRDVAQEQCWARTTQNMERIGAILCG